MIYSGNHKDKCPDCGSASIEFTEEGFIDFDNYAKVFTCLECQTNFVEIYFLQYQFTDNSACVDIFDPKEYDINDRIAGNS